MQRSFESKDFLRIEDAKIAELLIEPSKQKLLAPFFNKEATISEAAIVADVSHLLMFRYVKRFEHLGLLKITRSEPRQGRAIHFYQTTAKEFFIPAKVLPLETTLEVVERNAQKLFLHNLSQTLMKHEGSADLGTRISPSDTGTGVVATQIALKPGENWDPSVIEDAALVELWVNLRVSLEDAKQLQAELGQIVQRYGEKSGEEKYLLRLGLTPLD
jgi:hypothetical protein